jgi:hypothetical protein
MLADVNFRYGRFSPSGSCTKTRKGLVGRSSGTARTLKSSLRGDCFEQRPLAGPTLGNRKAFCVKLLPFCLSQAREARRCVGRNRLAEQRCAGSMGRPAIKTRQTGDNARQWASSAGRSSRRPANRPPRFRRRIPAGMHPVAGVVGRFGAF